MQHHDPVGTPKGEAGTAPDALKSRLTAAENVLATLAVDLDAELRFADGLLALTDRRLLSRGPDGEWREWALAPELQLQLADHAGVGTLDLLGTAHPLARWRYTLAQQPAALRLLKRFEQQAVGVADTGASTDPGDLAAEPELQPPPSTWVLLRLGRFARPYRKQLIAGFLLTLASTAATLVPPYLTIPLMDDILIPFQNGQQIPVGKVVMFLAALLAAALTGWGLGWARTYLLALVSERIGADLRTTTYEHLLTLPLDYFGGKRTGDLMSRIGSETDRINVFLSLHALDFATDVLMIVMTAVILVSINPLLAVVTLVPLPFIAWMIHVVRDRLRTGFEKIDRVWSEVTNVLADTIPGIRVVKAFAQETPRGRPLPRRQRLQPAGQRQAQQDLVAVHAHRVAAHRDRPAGGLGLRHLAGGARQHHGGCAHRLHRLHRALLHAARFDEPHRLGHAEGRGRRQAHLRHPRPCEQRARAGQPGEGRAPCRGASR
jgi:ATP-binding cassette subfamily B protein